MPLPIGGNGMKKGLAIAFLALQCAGSIVNAGLTCGSRDSGFWVTSGTLDLDGKTVQNGTIRENGGTVSGTITMDNSTFEVDEGATFDRMRLRGTYEGVGGAITLDATNEVLSLESGSTVGSVTVGVDSAGASVTARIEGQGDFADKITIGVGSVQENVDATLQMDLKSPLSENIVFNPGSKAANLSKLQLLSDLKFGDGKGFILLDGSGTSEIDCNNYTVSFGGQDLTMGATTRTITWSDASIELNAKLTLGDGTANVLGWTLTSTGVVAGNGNELACSTLGSQPIFTVSASDLTMMNVNLTGMQSGNLALTNSVLYLRDSSVKDSATASRFQVHGQAKITTTDGDFFGSPVVWEGAATLELLDDITFGANGKWSLGGTTVVMGNGRTWDLAAPDANDEGLDLNSNGLWLSNVSLIEMTGYSLSNPGDIYLSDVTLTDTLSNSVRIVGDTLGAAGLQSPAQISLSDQKTLFSGDVTFDTGVVMELLAPTTLAGGVVWSITKDSTIIGNGNMLDLTDATGAGLSVAASTKLNLRDIILKVDSSTVMTLGASAELNWSNVTLIITDTVSWSGNGKIVVDGSSTIMTGASTFTPPTTGNLINDVTLWYDTLGATDASNVLGSWGGTGQLAAVSANSETGDLTYTPSSYDLVTFKFLFPAEAGANGRRAIFTNSSPFVFDGHGRGFIMGDTSAVDTDGAKRLLKANTHVSNTVTLKDIILDGVLHEHFESNNAVGASNFIFGDGAHIRLQKDDTLSSTYTFRDSAAEKTIIVDLNGHSLDLLGGDLDVALTLSSDVIIKNGRLTGVHGNCLGGTDSSHTGTIRLQDVDVYLSDNATLNYGHFEIAGHTRFLVGGDATDNAHTLTLANTATELRVLEGATMTVGTGVTFASKDTVDFSDGTASTYTFVLDANSSTLELLGGNITFDAANKTIRNGRLVIDHLCEFRGDTKELTLGDATQGLDIQFMPGATLDVKSGTINYANAS